MSLHSAEGVINSAEGKIRTSDSETDEFLTTEDDLLIFTEDGEAALLVEAA